nr:hypothetical protein [Sedimentibacter sp.]
MFTINSTEARKEWSTVIDNAVRKKPQFIKRTRDHVVVSNTELFKNLLEPYKFSAKKFIEDDGSITLSLNEIDLIENDNTEMGVKYKMAASIMEYSEEFYKNFDYWGMAPNRKKHIPFVLKAIMEDDVNKIMESIECRSGEN